VFETAVVAAAMIDRPVHHAEVVSMKGDSYRLKDRDLGEGCLLTTLRDGGPPQGVNFQTVQGDSHPRGEPHGRMPMQSVSSRPFAPSASTESLCSANASSSRC
jgi:hypothetical protein